MSDAPLSQRLEFLDLGDDELALLAELRPLLERNADAFVAAFYRHLLGFEPTRHLLRDPETKRRLLGKQRDYLLSLATPKLDDDYAAQRRRIGEVHEQLGLEPRWYIGAYSLYFSMTTELICEAYAQEPERASRMVIAFQKILNFDTQLAMEAYIERHQRGLTYMADELAREGLRLERDLRAQGVTLRQTTRRARAAEELASIATLVAGLAHEIGTPMGVIQGHAKMLEGKVKGDDAIWRLHTIQEQIARISRIIQTLLNMARPGKGARQPVVLAPLVEQSLSFVQEKLGRRAITVESRLGDVPSVPGDPERLQQLILNLFLNAADAMPDGGELHVTLAAGDDAVELRVRDSGAGIAPADLERIFEPFYTTKEAGHGNGLGLMVCKGIVADHDGTLEVESELGEGTEFRVVLPLPRD